MGRNWLKVLGLLLFMFVLPLTVAVQLSQSKLESVRTSLRSLEMSRSQVSYVLLPDSFEISERSRQRQSYFRDSETFDKRSPWQVLG
jgi:hypothetical protein